MEVSWRGSGTGRTCMNDEPDAPWARGPYLTSPVTEGPLVRRPAGNGIVGAISQLYKCEIGLWANPSRASNHE